MNTKCKYEGTHLKASSVQIQEIGKLERTHHTDPDVWLCWKKRNKITQEHKLMMIQYSETSPTYVYEYYNLCTQWALYLGASDWCLESSTKAITPNHLHSNKSKDVAPNPFGNHETSWEHATVTSFVQTIVWISLKMKIHSLLLKTLFLSNTKDSNSIISICMRRFTQASLQPSADVWLY